MQRGGYAYVLAQERYAESGYRYCRHAASPGVYDVDPGISS
jgi:hypothetical protein